MKISTYSNPHYCLSFGNDTVFLDVEVEITRLSEVEKKFSARVTKSQLDHTQEDFPAFLVKRMTTEQLASVMAGLNESLLAEIDQSLFSLFYLGEVKDAN